MVGGAVVQSSKEQAKALHCLGVPELRVADAPVVLSRQHVRLFAVLAAAGPNGLDVDGLLDELYGDDVPSSRNQAVYSLVNRLSDDASACIVNDGGRYRVAPSVSVDAWRFEALVEQADPDSLVEGLKLWRGRAFDTIDAGPVVSTAAEGLRRSRSSAAESTALRASTDQLREVERQFHETLGDDPYNEPLAIASAGALYRLRKRRDALSIIQSCRARLRGDLGLDGSSDLDDAELALLRDQDPLSRDAAEPISTASGPQPLPGLLLPRATTFVGRDDQLATVADALASADNDGRGRVVLVSGEAGMGKSELLSQCANRTEGLTIRAGGSAASASAAYAPWVRALPEVAEAVETLGRSADVGVAQLIFWREVERAIADVAKKAPLLLVLEDMHQTDPQSALLLGWLASGSLPARAVIAATTRPPETGSLWADTSRAIREQAERGVATVIDLEPLSMHDVESMVAARFPSESPGRLFRFASQVHSLSQGNPLVSSALVADAPAPDDLVTSSGAPIEEHHAQAVLSRVDSVTAGVLTNAGLIGNEFELGTLAELCEMSKSTALVHVETAMAAGLVIESDELGHFRFDHVLTAEAFAQRASRIRRAETFTQLIELDSIPAADRVRYIRGAGSAIEARVAVDLLKTEAATLSAAHSFSEAQAALEYATERLESNGLEAPTELLIERADAAARAGDFERLIGYRNEAFTRAQSTDSAREMCRAAMVGLPASERSGGDEELFLLLSQIDGHQIEDDSLRGLFLHQFIRAARLVDRGDLALRTVKGLTRLDVNDAEMWAVLQSERILLEAMAGPDPAGLEKLDALVDALPPSLTRTQLRHRQFLLGLIYQDPETLRLRLPIARAEALDQPVPRVRWGLELAEVTLAQVGLLESALDSATALATGFRFGISDAFNAWGAQTWQKLWIGDEIHEAMELLDSAKGMIETNVGWMGTEAFGAAASGDIGRARALLPEISDRLEANPSGIWAPVAAAMLVEACELVDGSANFARTALEVLRPHSGTAILLGICVAYLGPADRFIGRAMRLIDDPDSDEFLMRAAAQSASLLAAQPR